MKGIDPFYAGTAPNLTVRRTSVKELISETPELVDRFKTAMEKSLKYSQEYPDAVRAVLRSTRRSRRTPRRRSTCRAGSPS